jgi:hypothetical protein
MMRRITAWVSRSWFSCKRYCERASRSWEKPLTGWDKAGFLIHHYTCRRCRVAHHHLKFLDRVLGKVTSDIEAGSGSQTAPSANDSTELRERIKKALAKSDPG